MFDTIQIGTSGLTSHADGLRVVGNNLTNVNTPGFKQSQVQFADLLSQGQHGGAGQGGSGLQSLAAAINFKAGEVQHTGNPYDASINGNGFFVLKNEGQLKYTRAGQFTLGTDGFLVSRLDGSRVQALDGNGHLADIALNHFQSSAPNATTKVTFSGNLSTDLASFTVNGINVIDGVGGQHTLSAVFTNNGAVTPGAWSVNIMDGGKSVATGTLQFNGGLPAAGSAINFSYAPAGVAAFPLTLDFSQDVTAYPGGTNATIAVNKADGYGVGQLSTIDFDADGNVVTHYTNGQSVKRGRLALAHFDSEGDINAASGSEFTAASSAAVHYGVANVNSLGAIGGGQLEGSNVDLAQEFSNLIVMQRGYQASSHVVSTANDLIQELFDMKGHR